MFMNSRILIRVLTLILAGYLPLPAQAQKADKADETRNAFLITRKKTSDGKPSHSTSPRRQRPAGRLGLGYTLYQKDQSDKPVRVHRSQVFRAGDGVRLVIEANTDGYLYVFHSENDGASRMIFPDVRLNGGDNRIRAHVPCEVPSRREADPRFRWYYFDDKAATERLYVAVTRKPLPGVLTREALVAHCRANPGRCPWRPASATWKLLVAHVDAPTVVSQDQTFGQVQTEVEGDAVERGLGLPADAPAPSVVKISASPKAGVLFTMLDLIHK
jgi:hypothetical protein